VKDQGQHSGPTNERSDRRSQVDAAGEVDSVTCFQQGTRSTEAYPLEIPSAGEVADLTTGDLAAILSLHPMGTRRYQEQVKDGQLPESGPNTVHIP
jgi:hypothetical protein